MKTGLIEKLKVGFSYMSFWSSPIEIEAEDVYLIVGPSTFFKSAEESYIEEGPVDLMNSSYDSTNAFNIFDHEMKIKVNSSSGNSQEAKN